MAHSVKTKRLYETADQDDGFRVLVDRLWPRGVAKGDLDYDLWCKELAPSAALRRWFDHRVPLWDGFKRDYAAELQEESKQSHIGKVFAHANGRRVTLLYGAKDTEHNQAVVLADEMMRYANRHKLG